MLFEDEDNLSSARIARTNALNAYREYKSFSSAGAPDFPLPADYSDKGEAVIFHFNGKAPYKISRQIMFAWNNIWFTLQGNDDLKGVSQDVINAVFAGAFGKSISVSFAEFIDNAYIISSSSAFDADGQEIKTQLVSDISSAAKKTLKDENTADTARMLTRAVTKYILSVQARHAASKISKNESVGQLTGILFSALSNITEKADTRSWFTLPAEIRMASLFLPPGKHNIKFVMYDNSGKTIDEHLFENVQINKGQRTYLYHRSAK
jgi:hypothetical protein